MISNVYTHQPKLVPRTISVLPQYRNFFPVTKALKECLDANPIDKMDLDTARKAYGRCVKNSLGSFVPGHHPNGMSLELHISLLHQEQKRVNEDYPKHEKQSMRIKLSLIRMIEARKYLP